MSRASHASHASDFESRPDFLKSAQEYRDRLKAELAKVDAFLREADRRPDPCDRACPDFLTTGVDDVLDVLHPGGAGSASLH